MSLKIFYNIGMTCLTLFWLPKFVLGRLSGKYKQSLGERLGFGLKRLDLPANGKRVWIHACSVGETKAAAPFVAEIKKRYPDISIVVSSTTETGHAEARRAIPFADAYFYLPLDFSWIARRLMRYLRPTMFVLTEAEFWWNMIHEAKLAGAEVALVNGKMSERSLGRFLKAPFLSRPIFTSFDCCCVQTPSYQQAFLSLGVPQEKMWVTGNLKFDFAFKILSQEEITSWQAELGLHHDDLVIVLASTHEPEEEILLNALQPFLETCSRLKVLIVPRHPHRFDDVAKLIQRRGMPWMRYSERSKKETTPRLILIDAMGQLMSCFQLASLAIVAGSFVPGIGGHNLFEPAGVGVPTLFGPYVDAQRAYADALIEAKGGLSLTPEELQEAVMRLISNPEERHAMGKRALEVVDRSRGAVSRTVGALENFLRNSCL